MTFKSPAIIVDLDGTLANLDHRLHLIERERPDWEAFFDACSEDSPISYMVPIIEALRSRFRIIILTGRPDSHNIKTMGWLRRHGFHFDNLIMRRTGDHRPDHVVKLEKLEHINQFFNVVCAIEDRPSVVKMWRENGIPCLAADDASWHKND